MIQLISTPKMTTTQVVETSVTVNNNSPIQDYVHPDDQTQQLDQDKFSCLQQVNSPNSQDKFQIITDMQLMRFLVNLVGFRGFS